MYIDCSVSSALLRSCLNQTAKASVKQRMWGGRGGGQANKPALFGRPNQQQPGAAAAAAAQNQQPQQQQQQAKNAARLLQQETNRDFDDDDDDDDINLKQRRGEKLLLAASYGTGVPVKDSNRNEDDSGGGDEGLGMFRDARMPRQPGMFQRVFQPVPQPQQRVAADEGDSASSLRRRQRHQDADRDEDGLPFGAASGDGTGFNSHNSTKRSGLRSGAAAAMDDFGEQLARTQRDSQHAEEKNAVVAIPPPAQNGRYGPYLKKGTDSRSLGSEDEIFSITLEQAEAIYAQPKQRGRAAAKPPLRELGEDPTSGRPIVVKDGRFGPYVTDGQTNATLRKDDSVEDITPERAQELLAEKRAKGPAKKSPTKKKTTRKTTTRTTTTKKTTKATSKSVKVTKANAKTSSGS